jgi:5-methylcytosine-specific restriction endonuclease McrA
MNQAEHNRGTRFSLQAPIPEIELAAKLLDACVEALTIGNTDLARRLFVAADIPEIMAYAVRNVGKISLDIHRVTKRPKCLPREQRHPQRMPIGSEQRSIFSRDGWRCRFCGIKVIEKSARSKLAHRFQIESRWSGPEFQRHSALYAMGSSLDHIVPHGRGGKNESENFVTACYCCQFGRGEWLLEEVEIEDPRLRAPIRDQWDGLERVNKLVL